jgi:serine/threonine-protein kinase
MQRGQQVGPFVIEKALGSGAMGTVFRARHTETGQHVAIKVVVPALVDNPTSMERFKRESAILKQLKHPNIVRLVATGRFQGSPFYAMEYIEGESLDRVMARRGRLTWEEVVTLGKQLCAALQHAHDKGIIHRDLKPSNLMVLPDGSAKLTDFGIAKDMDVTALTAANCTVGTASYMSPEQCRGERNVTPKSDLYSLGVMFYELLTGRKPFVAEAPMEMFMLHLKATCERPSRRVFDIPVWLDTLVMQLLEKKPEQRPYSAAAVGEALDRVREKVEAQQSAGVDAVRSRAIDRKPTMPRLEEEDREAARSLLGKKKRKKRATPFYRKVWFRGAVAAVLLAGIAWVFYSAFLKKPSPEDLYRRAFDLMGNTDTFQEAREGPIADFLRYYPDRDDKQARDIRSWADRVDLETREKQMYNRRSRQFAEEGEAEPHARRALDAEEKGDLATALEEWQAVAKLRQEKDPDKRAWGLVGEKYKKDLDKAFELLKEIQLKVERERFRKEDKKTPLEELAIQATRAERKGQAREAAKYWQTLQGEARKGLEQRPWERPWVLLATGKLHELAEAVPPDKQ